MRPSTKHNRWLDWAGAVSARYRHVAVWPGAAAMSFAQRRSTRIRVLLRHHTTALAAYPRVHLSIQPHVFFQGVWPVGPGRDRIVERRVQSVTRDVVRAEAGSVRSEPVRQLLRPTPAPLATVFRRLYRVDELSRTVRREMSEQHATLFVDRILRTTRRVEDSALPRPAATLRAAPAHSSEPTVEVAATSRPPRPQMPPDTWAARNLPSSATSAGVNVDQITDHVLRQLDHRITAWRERTGRV